MKIEIPESWDLNDHQSLRDYYDAIENVYTGYKILGFIRKQNKTFVVLRKC